ncbi:hypothetical protein [Sphingobium lactosutens]|uniref:hypothetical protein n=1 Tax=Sphingobium lactosutens TaxID=522773 RepID=UPI0015BAF19B|nr:hypothetical protein [Sphingobium lactosutens]
MGIESGLLIVVPVLRGVGCAIEKLVWERRISALPAISWLSTYKRLPIKRRAE